MGPHPVAGTRRFARVHPGRMARARPCEPIHARARPRGRVGVAAIRDRMKASRQLKGWERTAGRSVALTAGLLILLGSCVVWAGGAPTAGGGLPNFDVRVGKEGHAVRNLLNPPSATLARRVDLFTKIEAARQRLQWSIPGLSVETHPIHGVPEVITARGMFLTPPNPKADAELIVRNFLLATAPLYGLSQAEVRALETTANYANPAGNLRWVILEQGMNRRPGFRGELPP